MTDVVFTPGPWMISGDTIIAAHVGVICRVPNHPDNGKNWENDRELIAAAPDLLDTLKSVQLTLEGAIRHRLATDGEMSAEQVASIVDAHPTIKKVRATLAKVERAS